MHHLERILYVYCLHFINSHSFLTHCGPLTHSLTLNPNPMDRSFSIFSLLDFSVECEMGETLLILQASSPLDYKIPPRLLDFAVSLDLSCKSSLWHPFSLPDLEVTWILRVLSYLLSLPHNSLLSIFYMSSIILYQLITLIFLSLAQLSMMRSSVSNCPLGIATRILYRHYQFIMSNGRH